MHPSCLECPRPVCWFDLTPAQRGAEVRQDAATLSHRTQQRRAAEARARIPANVRRQVLEADAAARRAGQLRRAGWTQQAIADELGRSLGGVQRLLARPAARVPSWTDRAQRAGELRRAGHTLDCIARQLGNTRKTVIGLLRLPEAGPPPPRRGNGDLDLPQRRGRCAECPGQSLNQG